MAKFTLEIDCDNAAFEDIGEAQSGALAEVGRILGVASKKLQRATTTGKMRQGLMDGNGNSVGSWTYDPNA